MNFLPGEDAEQLRAVVREFLAKRSDETAVRAQMASERGYDVTVWRQSVAELGLPGLIAPERFGGTAASAVELAVVFEEMGAALFCGPFAGAARRGPHRPRRRNLLCGSGRRAD